MWKPNLALAALVVLGFTSTALAGKGIPAAMMKAIRADARANTSYSKLKSPTLAIVEKRSCRCGDHSSVKVELRSRGTVWPSMESKQVPQATAKFSINLEARSVRRQGSWQPVRRLMGLGGRRPSTAR